VLLYTVWYFGYRNVCRYSIVVDDNEKQQLMTPFIIDPISGTLSTKFNLDRESIDTYTVTIAARDNGRLVQRSTTVNVTIFIGDVNDNKPTIINAPVDIYVRDSLKQGQNVYTNT